ncbi:MAG: cytochrome c [Chloroflexi bacterium]|nr:cytochrome c [Chloroflexota bacterium]
MSFDWYKRLFLVLVALGAIFGFLMLFAFDVIKIEWISFMEIQPSYKWNEKPLPVPARSVPIDGPVSIPNIGAPENPVPADGISIARGQQLFSIHCAMCHGPQGLGNGQVAAFLANKPANLTSDVVQAKSDGSLFLTISNGITGRMPALNENLTPRERWDIVNFLRTLKAQP